MKKCCSPLLTISLIFLLIQSLQGANLKYGNRYRNLSSSIEFTDNLLAYYKLDNNANDSYNTNDASPENVNPTLNRNSEADSAYSFDGTSDSLIYIPESILNGLEQFSIFMWLKPSQAFVDGSNNHLIHGTKTGNDHFLVTFQNFCLNDDTTTNCVDYPTEVGGKITQDEWIHFGVSVSQEKIKASKDRTSFKIYINGKIAYESIQVIWFSMDAGVNGINIGQDAGSLAGTFDGTKAFKGDISDIRIYGKAITPNIVNSIYESEKVQSCSFSCSGCDGDLKCSGCTGNRVLHNGMCLCPQGTQEDFESTDCPVIKDIIEGDIVAHMPLKGNLMEKISLTTGINYDLILDSDRFGNKDSSFRFLNKYTYIDAEPLRPLINGQNILSISMWLKKTGNTGANNNHFFSCANSLVDNELLFYRNHFVFGGVAYYHQELDFMQEDDVWYQIVAVIDVLQYKIYKDGLLIHIGEKVDHSFVVDKGGVIVGSEQDSVGGGFQDTQYFGGSVSDIRIYGAVLDDKKVSYLYNFEKYPCSFSCGTCLWQTSKCATCKGNRILSGDECVCPQGTQEDTTGVSEDCIDYLTGANESLFAHFPFHNNMTDVINGYEGVPHNLKPTVNRFGESNSAYKFVDNTTYANMPVEVINGQNLYTITTWIKYDSLELQQNFFLHGTSGQNTDTSIAQDNPNSSNNLLLGLYAIHLYGNTFTGPDAAAITMKDKIITPQNKGKWQHFAIAVDSEVFKVYINAELIAEGVKTEYTQQIVDDDRSFILGQEADHIPGAEYDFDPEQAFIGDLSDMKFYHKVLSWEEINAVFYEEKYHCGFGCTGCFKDSSDCIACKGDRIMVNGQCIPPQGKFEDFKSVTTPSCSYQCSDCAGSESDCSVCPYNRINAPDCVCLPGYFDQGNGDQECLKCDPKCQKCDKNATSCTSCSGLFRVLNEKNSVCECDKGYLDDGINLDCIKEFVCDEGNGYYRYGDRCLKCFWIEGSDDCYKDGCPVDFKLNRDTFQCEENSGEITAMIIFICISVIAIGVIIFFIIKRLKSQNLPIQKYQPQNNQQNDVQQQQQQNSQLQDQSIIESQNQIIKSGGADDSQVQIIE